jgi:isocitrate lyase
MTEMGIFTEVHNEVGQIIVAAVDSKRIKELLAPDRDELLKLIAKRK